MDPRDPMVVQFLLTVRLIVVYEFCNDNMWKRAIEKETTEFHLR